ncbi:MAG TPA: hypothetical protein VIT91_12565, partial [Chthoniobacterales bacterium]
MAENCVEWLRLHPGCAIAPSGYQRLFATIAKSAGATPWPRNAMRHSFASYHLAAHRNETATQAQMGHDSGR